MNEKKIERALDVLDEEFHSIALSYSQGTLTYQAFTKDNNKTELELDKQDIIKHAGVALKLLDVLTGEVANDV